MFWVLMVNSLSNKKSNKKENSSIVSVDRKGLEADSYLFLDLPKLTHVLLPFTKVSSEDQTQHYLSHSALLVIIKR